MISRRTERGNGEVVGQLALYRLSHCDLSLHFWGTRTVLWRFITAEHAAQALPSRVAVPPVSAVPFVSAVPVP